MDSCQPIKYWRYQRARQRVEKRCRAITDCDIADRRRDQIQVRTEPKTLRSRGTITRQRGNRKSGRDEGEEQRVSASRKATDPRANRLLGLLTADDYERLRPHLQPIVLDYRKSLYEADKLIEFVWFIESGVGSLVNTMANGDAAEVGTIGNEGLVGLPLLLGDDRAPTAFMSRFRASACRMNGSAVRQRNWREVPRCER